MIPGASFIQLPRVIACMSPVGKSDDQMGAVRFGKELSLTLERHQVGSRGRNRFRRNGRFHFVFRNEAGRQWIAVQHDLMKGPHSTLTPYAQGRGSRAFD
jgi:hypothetical protein